MMNPKSVLTAVLLLFVIISIIVLISRESVPRQGPESSESAQSADQSPIGSDTEAVTPAESPGSVDSPDSNEPSHEAESSPSASPSSQSDRLVVYYFHGTARCRSCMTIERFTREAVFDFFVDAIENGTLEWLPLNVDEPVNEHFRVDYELFTRSVIVSELQAGEEVRWKNLDRVWSLLSDEGEFKSYIRVEIVAWMEEIQ